jgi:hypothetical protein
MEALILQAESDFDGWPLAMFLIAMFICIAAVLSIVAWQIFATWRARMSVAREEAYRALAEESTRSQQRTADRLESVVSELTDIRQRTAELERLLKEVG